MVYAANLFSVQFSSLGEGARLRRAAANELRKAGLEVKVFEKSVGMAGVWRANYTLLLLGGVCLN